jgi:hypothetical protein
LVGCAGGGSKGHGTIDSPVGGGDAGTGDGDSGDGDTGDGDTGDGDSGDGDVGDGDIGDGDVGDGDVGDGDVGDGDAGDGDIGDGDAGDGDIGDGGVVDGPDSGMSEDPDAGPPADPSTLTLDVVQMRGTHNSYHQMPTIAFDASHKYQHLPLDQQLQDQGVRVLELDLHNATTDDSIDVYHIFGIDPRTSCNDFEVCLRTIRGWSEAHPLHVPVIVWFEMKDDTGGPAFKNLDKVDEVLRQEMGDRLLTPDMVKGDAPSLHEAITTRGWPTLDSVRGKFLFIVLNNDEDIDQYTQGYSTLAGKAMFVRVNADRFTSPVATFAKLGVDEADTIRAGHEAKLILGTNVCGINEADEACEQKRVSAIAAGIHLLQDDLPAPISGRNYFMALPEGKPVACNPVRAPQGCTAEALEKL